MSWTARLTGHKADGIVTFDSAAPLAASYAVNGEWPGGCNVHNILFAVALKATWRGAKYVQGAANASAAGFFSTWTIAFNADVTAGNCIVVDLIFGSGFPLSGVTVTDSLGNTYKPVIGAHILGAASFGFCFVAPNISGGANTITLTQTGLEDFAHVAVAIHEYSGLSHLLPTGTPPTNFGGYSDPTGVCDATLFTGGPAVNTLSGALVTTQANDLLHAAAGSTPYCGGATATGGGDLPTPPAPPLAQRGNIDYDQVRAAVRSGPGPEFLMLEGLTVAGDGIVFDSLGNAVDSGAPPGTVTHTGTLTADLPVFGNGAADIKVGTKSGNTNELASVSGALTSGHGIKSDASGNLVDSGAVPGTVTHTAGALTADLPVFGAGGADVKVGTKSGNTDEVVTQSGAATSGAPLFYDASGNAIAGTKSGNTNEAATVSGALTSTHGVVSDASGNLVDSGSVPGTVTHTAGALTADLPVFGAGGADVKVGTKSGNTDEVATVSGALTSGHGVVSDASGNLVDSGAVPGTVTHTGALTADLPLFGNGTADAKVGTKTGNTNALVSATGASTSGAPLLYDASGNAISGTKSGNTTELVSATGASTSGYPLLYDASGNAVARQPRGNTTVVQLADATTNPTTGDLAKFDANGNIADAGVLASAILSNPMTTKGDVIVGATGGTPARLAVGTNGQVLTANSAATNGEDWEAPIALTTTGSSGAATLTPGNPYTLNVPQYSGGGGSGALTQLAQTILGADTATFSFASISAAYTDLIVVVTGRTDEAATGSAIYLQFNGDTAANYLRQELLGNNATVSAGTQTAVAKPQWGAIAGNNATAAISGSFKTEIFFYTNATFAKNCTTLSAFRTAATGASLFAPFDNNWWTSTAAINAIVIGCVTVGAKFKSGSVATLYGRQ